MTRVGYNFRPSDRNAGFSKNSYITSALVGKDREKCSVPGIARYHALSRSLADQASYARQSCSQHLSTCGTIRRQLGQYDHDWYLARHPDKSVLASLYRSCCWVTDLIYTLNTNFETSTSISQHLTTLLACPARWGGHVQFT